MTKPKKLGPGDKVYLNDLMVTGEVKEVHERFAANGDDLLHVEITVTRWRSEVRKIGKRTPRT